MVSVKIQFFCFIPKYRVQNDVRQNEPSKPAPTGVKMSAAQANFLLNGSFVCVTLTMAVQLDGTQPESKLSLCGVEWRLVDLLGACQCNVHQFDLRHSCVLPLV